MTILTATIASVKFGSVEIEGLMFPDGSYGVAIPQICDLFADTLTFKTSRNTAARDLKRLMDKDFKTSNCRTEFNRGTTTYVDLIDFERVLRKLDKNSNPVAEAKSEALIGVALHQLFCDAFEVKLEENDRQEFLKTRLAGKLTRRTLTDAIKTYLETHEVSANYRQWVFSNCSDKINLALFGKKAAKLCTERGCERDELRDTHDEPSLALIDRIEGHAVRLIDRGMEPQLATQDAINFYI